MERSSFDSGFTVLEEKPVTAGGPRDWPPPGFPTIRYRNGVPPKALSYYGHTDRLTFAQFEGKVDVWVVRSSPYMAASEQGLILLEALSLGGVGIFLNGKVLFRFNAKDGVAALMNLLRRHYGADLCLRQQEVLKMYGS